MQKSDKIHKSSLFFNYRLQIYINLYLQLQIITYRQNFITRKKTTNKNTKTNKQTNKKQTKPKKPAAIIFANYMIGYLLYTGEA